MGLRELAEKAGVPHGYLSELENGEKKNPSPDLRKRLAGALGLLPEDLERKEEARMVVKVVAVREWLVKRFPACNVLNQSDFMTGSELYRVDDRRRVRHKILVSEEFLSDHALSEIPAVLERWRIEDRIHEAGQDWTVVTNQGVSVQQAIRIEDRRS